MRRTLRRLRRLSRSEDGIALPTAIFAMIATFALASAAILSSVDAQQGSHRDSESKNAIAAADAGASVALLRLNRFADNLSASSPCVGPAGEPQTPTAGWCPATQVEAVGGSTYTYQMSAYAPEKELTVVALGTAEGVTRRVKVGFISYAGEEVFADEHLIGQDNITLEGTPDIRTDVGTNGSIKKQNNGTGTICGDIRHGVGKEWIEPDCDGEVSEGNKDLPEVLPPENIATVNSNCRLAANCADKTEFDSFVGSNKKEKRTATEPWEAATRTINIGGNSTLTMGGTDYFVCRLFVSGQLIMAAGAEVRVWFDTPEHCGLQPGAVRMEVGNNGVIKSSGYIPEQNQYAVPGFYMLGSPDIPTTIKLEGNSRTNEMVLYAPYSEIDLGGSATWIGMIAGKSLKLHGTPRVEADPGISPPDIHYKSLWERTHYVECVGATGSPPDASC